MASRLTVVTGADGYVGSRVAAALLARGERVVAVARDRSRRPAITGALLASGAQVFEADLRAQGTLDGLDAEGVERVVHAAAVTRFNVDHETASAVNVGGTRAVLEYAARCRDLNAFALLSTAYAMGLAGGRMAESCTPATDGFANEYEWSKYEAERLALADFAGLPVRVVRLATAIADDRSGEVTQYNAFHTTLRLVYYGLLSVLPGMPATPVHLTSGRYAVDGTVALLDDPAASGVYHLAATAPEPVTVAELLDVAWSRFDADPDFKRRGVLRPLFVDLESFTLLADETASLGRSVIGQAMATMAPFARQLYVAKDLATERARAALDRAGVVADDPHDLVRAAIEHVVSSRWGRANGHAA